MKKLLIGLGILLMVVVLALVIIPVIFKDDIKNALDKAIAENVNARVFYDEDQLSLSLIKNFPNFTLSIGDFGIVGLNEFEKDTLTAVREFAITIDIQSIFSGSEIQINEVIVAGPSVSILVLEDGKANYDIAVATEEAVEEEETASSDGSDLVFSVKKWQIVDGSFAYEDRSMNFYTTVTGLQHEGSGDFTLSAFTLSTVTQAAGLSLGYEGVTYIANKPVAADVNMDMNLHEMKFTFLDNRVALSDFVAKAEGYISMPAEDIEMDISFNGSDISLKGILSLIPGAYQEYLDGVSAGGSVGFDGFVRGTYNESSMPAIAANLSVADGEIGYEGVEVPMEQININADFSYPSTDLSETSFNVSRFSMLVDGEELTAYLKFKDLVNYTWDTGINGNADLGKIARLLPMEGTTLEGKIQAAFSTSGNMDLIEEGRYDELPTSGSLNLSGFKYVSELLPQGFEIANANMTLDPKSIRLNEFSASSGNSDFAMTGNIDNYLGFGLKGEMLIGRLDFNSNLIDVNEFLPETSEEAEIEEEETDTTSLEVIRIPENIDFTLASSIGSMQFGTLDMKDFKGAILIRDGAIRLDETTFNLLEGAFTATGAYDTKGEGLPTFDFGFGIKDLSISSAYQSFETVQQYAPVAEKADGSFSTDFTIDGVLGTDMMPLTDSINMDALVRVKEAILEKGEFVQTLSSVASFTGVGGNSSTSIALKNVLVKAKIIDGTLYVEPFDLSVAGQKATFGGSNKLGGTLDYFLLVKEVPTGSVGDALNSLASSFLGTTNNLISDKLDFNFGVGGTVSDPSVKLLGTSSSGSSGEDNAAEAAVEAKLAEQKKAAEDAAKKAKEEAEAKAKAEAERKKKEAEEAAKKAEAEAKKKLEEEKKKLEEEKKKAEEEAKNKLKGLIKKKGGGK